MSRFRNRLMGGIHSLLPQGYTRLQYIYFPCMNRGITYFMIEGKWNGMPCIDPNGVVGMYDIVNNEFHSSPNGTAFNAGPILGGGKYLIISTLRLSAERRVA